MTATFKGKPGRLTVLDPKPASKQFIDSIYHPPSWAEGFISRDDARFLYHCLEEFTPTTVLEIGVASGVSTVLLLESMEALGLEARLYSFDIQDKYYARPDLQLGHHIFERFGTPPSRLSLNPLVGSMYVADRLKAQAPGLADFTFIDANHYQPWPCLDLLAILEVVKPGSWVALHDIDLPNLAPQYPCYGPLRLFNAWPGERRVFPKLEQSPNIGAIRLFDTLTQNVDAILGVLAQPWDVQVDYWDFEKAAQVVRLAGTGRANRLAWIHYRQLPPADRRKYLIDRAKDMLRPMLGRPARSQA